jgi:hypothetical protein
MKKDKIRVLATDRKYQNRYWGWSRIIWGLYFKYRIQEKGGVFKIGLHRTICNPGLKHN